MRKNSLKRIFAALALTAVATTSVASVSAFAAPEDGADDSVVAGEETPSEETPSEETPSEETPSEEAPSEEAPSEEAPSEEAPSEEAPSEEAPSEEAPSEEEPSEEAPAVAAGPQEDGSFVMPDGTVYTADQIAGAETKPTISVTQATYTMEEVDAMGGIVPVTISVSGADMKWCSSGIHLYYDTELTAVLNKLGIPENTKGEAIEFLSSEIATEDGGIFITTAGSADNGFDGAIITYNFQLPEGYAPGDKWDLDLRYVSGDLFVNNAKDEAGMLMQAYALSNMVDGYIEIEAEPTTAPETEPVETTAPETEAPTTTTTKAPEKGDAPATGVAGVGVAVAGLAVAAGAAFVLRKKED